MSYFELFGAAGTGKSTLYDYWSKSSSSRLLSQTDAKREHVRRVAADISIGQNLMTMLASSIPGLKRAFIYSKFEAQSSKSVQKFCYTHAEFHSFMLDEIIGGLATLERKSLALQMYFQTINLHSTCNNSDFYVFYDELLLQRLSTILLAGRESSDEKIIRFASLVPKPLGAIHIIDDPEAIVKKIYLRQQRVGRMNSQHQGLSHEQLLKNIEFELKAYRLLSTHLESSGVDILRLDAQSQLESSCLEIEDYFKKKYKLT